MISYLLLYDDEKKRKLIVLTYILTDNIFHSFFIGCIIYSPYTHLVWKRILFSLEKTNYRGCLPYLLENHLKRLCLMTLIMNMRISDDKSHPSFLFGKE